MAGEYKVGDLIVPQEFQRAVLKNDKIITETITIQGRKISLYDIRKDMAEKHQQYMRLRTDEEFKKMSQEDIIKELTTINEYDQYDPDANTNILEKLMNFQRTRHLMVWHDGSSVASHGHLLIMVSCLYDPAMYYTDEEYRDISNCEINVQSAVEKPHLYILARCPSNDQQLLYAEERVEDLIALKNKVQIKGINIHDIARIFKGDSPAAAFEAGQQKGGHYFCYGCKLHAECSSSLVHTYKLKAISLQDRIDLIHKSPSSTQRLRNGNTKVLENLDKAGVIDELHQRKINFCSSTPLKDLREKLTSEMHGVQRLPAIMFGRTDQTLKELNLESYEILCNEPLHDVSNHIKNIYEELPRHLGEDKKNVSDMIHASFNNKEAKNSADHRKSLLVVTNWFSKHLPNSFGYGLLQTLAEMQEILYMPDSKRCPRTVLRLMNVTFRHAMLIKLNIRGQLEKLGSRKFFGVYYHSLVRHAPLQYRVISGRSANTEKEEASFNPIKSVTKLTSNNHPDNIISNAMIRLQAAEKINAGQYAIQSFCSSLIHKLYQPISRNLDNTIIPFHWIRNYSRDYQVLLQQQADYLLDGKWWFESDEGVIFLDHRNIPTDSNIKLHHFRSSNLQQEESYLNYCWNHCLQKMNTLIPAYHIELEDGSKVILNTLKYFEEISQPSQKQSLPSTPTKTGPTPNLDTTMNISEFITMTPVHDLKSSTPLNINKSHPSPSAALIIPSSSLALTPLTCSTSSNEKKKKHSISSSSFLTKENSEDGINVILKPKIIHVSSSQLSKTAQLMQNVLAKDEDLIKNYDKQRKLIKSKKTSPNNADYQTCVAKLEIKIKTAEEKIKTELRTLEMNSLESNNGNSLLPTDEVMKEQYNKKVMKLKYCKILRRELNF